MAGPWGQVVSHRSVLVLGGGGWAAACRCRTGRRSMRGEQEQHDHGFPRMKADQDDGERMVKTLAATSRVVWFCVYARYE